MSTLRPFTPPPRSEEILDRCKTAFAAKGFDGASMQDLARAAGMSASNFYRYFDSKDAIIVAFVEREMEEIGRRVAALGSARDLRTALLVALESYITQPKEEVDGAIWAEIQAAVYRRPALAQALQSMEERVALHLTGLFARLSGLSAAEAARRYQAHAAMIFLLARGALMMRSAPGPSAVSEDRQRLVDLVLQVAARLVDDIADSR